METTNTPPHHGYKPLLRVRGSCSDRIKTQMEGRKDKNTCKKGKMA